MIFIPTYFGLQISVLRYSYFAYTLYGVAITPALLAALAWKRATRAGGVASIVSGAFMVVFFDLIVPRVMPHVMQGGDPWGVPSIYPAGIMSIGTLIVVSLLTPKPRPEDLVKLFPEASTASRASK
jgi:Na+/proline symporter